MEYLYSTLAWLRFVTVDWDCGIYFIEYIDSIVAIKLDGDIGQYDC